MRFLLTFLLTFTAFFGSNLSTYNIYERSDRVDIMLSFDAPYQGNIFQKRENNTTILIFNGLSFEQTAEKSLNSKILQELLIEPRQNSVALSLKSGSQIAVSASKTSDGFGLRVRVTSDVATPAAAQPAVIPNETAVQTRSNLTPIVTVPDDQSFFDARYYMVLGVLTVFAISLWLLKNFFVKRAGMGGLSSGGSWLKSIKNRDDIEIIYEKSLDKFNKVMLLNHQNKRYLVLVGSSNVLLDKFGEERIESEEDFQAFFEENRKRLGQYLEERQNSLNIYKDKISQE